jgi:hypothetical protein
MSDNCQRNLSVGVLAVSLALLTACSGSTSAGEPAAMTSSSSAPSSTTAGSASPGVPALRVVGLGDSYMTAQNSKGQSFLNLYAEELQKTLGRPVDVTSLARNDGTTANVRENLTSNADYRVRSPMPT